MCMYTLTRGYFAESGASCGMWAPSVAPNGTRKSQRTSERKKELFGAALTCVVSDINSIYVTFIRNIYVCINTYIRTYTYPYT